MKILAIRGKNLASLAGEFEVDFQAEPLASAGLFAITGPTGAGKSTLLDALCLALFERTPRLTRVTGRGEIPDVGEHATTAADPRTLLRRGCAEGFAEVDYVGREGVAWRARWTVRRARNKQGGKLQNTEVSLCRLADGLPVGGHRKGEVQQAIEESIGLSFEQFTRAVLLAQNDFATFLKASDDERAELLQTLTGTHTYTQLSQLAYQRMKAEQEALARLQQQLADQAPLAPELRAEQAAEADRLAAEQAALGQHKAALEARREWFRHAATLQQAVAEAERKALEAHAARDAAAPRRAQLARLDAVQPARPLLASVERIKAELPRADERCRASAAALAAQRETLAQHATRLGTAAQQLAAAEDRRRAAQPLLDQAKALDTRIATLAPQHAAAAHAVQAAEARQAEADTHGRQTRCALEHLQRDLAAARDWLQAHPGERPLGEAWPRWDAAFAQAARLAGQLESSAAQRTRLTASLAALEARLRDAGLLHQQRAAAEQQARTALATLTGAAQAVDPDALARRKAALEGQRDALASARQLHGLRHDSQLARQRLDTQRSALQARIDDSRARIGQAAAARPALDLELAATTRALETARLVASDTAEKLRAQLQPDAPCPVCGATDHPYVARSPQVEAMLDGLRQGVEQAQAALHRLAREQGEAEAAHAAATSQLAALDIELATQREAAARLAADWQAHPLHAELQAQAETALPDWLAARQHATAAELDALLHTEARWRDGLRQRDVAQQAVDAAGRLLADSTRQLAALELEHHGARQSADDCHARLVELALHLDEQLAPLDEALVEPGWRDAWRADPAAFSARCAARAGAWLAHQQRVSDGEARAATLAIALAAAEDAAGKARQHSAAALDAARQLGTALDADRQARAGLFDGAPTLATERRLDQAIADSRASLDEARHASQRADADAARLAEAQRQHGLQRDALTADHVEAGRQLEAWLAAFNAGGQGGDPLDHGGLAALLAFDAAWIKTEAAALQALEQGLARADAVGHETRRALAAHAAARPAAMPPDDSPEAVHLALAELDTQAARLAEALAGLRLSLARDDEKLARSASLRAAIDAQAGKTRVWAQLGELIGSADGKKFRNFAQQLTLDVLLGYANLHLESLSRRYRLERLKDSLGLLVVDQDMGNEIRSVHSLSGGESFLVSLALALALASLSSHRVRVESLFIDEGFGSLDADSLLVAMEALDKLQAQGRKVGVISHVHEMTERIGTRIKVRRSGGGVSRVEVE